MFSGPIPHPSILEGYERIVPGSAERILSMAESDRRHQQEKEMEELLAFKRGQAYAFILALVIFAVCVISLLLGSELLAVTLGGATICALVGAFLVGKFKKDE